MKNLLQCINIQQAKVSRNETKSKKHKEAKEKTMFREELEKKMKGVETMSIEQKDRFLQAAYAEAQKGLAEGGIPIGALLVIDGNIVARGHNRRVQKGSAILHAEMDCLEKAGRLKASDYQRATLYTTLSPCDMCSGAALLYKIPKIVIGENITFQGPEDYLRSRGVELVIVNDKKCIEMLRDFITNSPALWNEDIGK